jgi:hypothetical protein
MPMQIICVFEGLSTPGASLTWKRSLVRVQSCLPVSPLKTHNQTWSKLFRVGRGKLGETRFLVGAL